MVTCHGGASSNFVRLLCLVVHYRTYSPNNLSAEHQLCTVYLPGAALEHCILDIDIILYLATHKLMNAVCSHLASSKLDKLHETPDID